MQAVVRNVGNCVTQGPALAFVALRPTIRTLLPTRLSMRVRRGRFAAAHPLLLR